MILQNDDRVKIEIVDDILRKTIKYSSSIDNVWLCRYNVLREWEPRCVEVYSVGENYIEMEYIDGAVTVEDILKNKTRHSLDERIDITDKYLDLMSRMQKRLCLDSNMFIHTDVWSGNVLVESNNELVLIDPDSCVAHPDLGNIYGDFVSNFLRATNKYYGMLKQKADV